MSGRAGGRMVADRYALSAPLGRGGMGVVWRARDAVLGREVAVKEVVFPPTMLDEERRPVQARVMREARAAARLNHPGAVTLYDVVKDRGGTFIVMELINAPTLADLVRSDGPLPVERVAEIGAQVASALEAAHQAGIVHRDVKPGNVMVPGNGTAKLADFGIASLQGDPQLTSTGLVIGSPAYMAPEQAKGEESGPPADFWALGATLFYAVEGEPPFDRGTSIATLAAVVNDPPRTPRRAGRLTPVITALLAKDPGSRPSGPDLRAALGRLAAIPPSPPTEVLPVYGPGRTIPLPAAPDPAAAAVPPDATPVPPASADPTPAGAVDNPEPPAPPSATLPLRGTSAPEVGFSPAGPVVAAAGPAATDVAGSERAGDAADPPRGADPPDPAAASTPVAAGPGSDPPPAVSAARPGHTAGPGVGRPVLPPAPVVERGGRGRMVAVVALLAVAGLVAVLLAVNLRSGGDGDPAASPATTAAGGAGANGESETTGAATSTTGGSETTAAPTTTAGGTGLPGGWTAFTNRRGSYRIGVPPGFRAQTRESNNATVAEEEDDPERVFTVRSTNPSNPLPQASRDYRRSAPGLFPEGYREISYEEGQTYAGRPGAVVFEYEAVRDGRRVHVSHINVKGQTWGYNVEFIVPADQWDAAQDLARQFEQAFQPLG
jgi:eukaryotic-like serine/threonine-protein kinase